MSLQETTDVIQNGNGSLEVTVSSQCVSKGSNSNSLEPPANGFGCTNKPDVRTVVLDCTGIVFVDIVGAKTLKQVNCSIIIFITPFSGSEAGTRTSI